MRILGKILRGLAILLGVLLLLILVLLATLWWKPELLLNEARVRQALAWAPAGTKVTWEKFRWDFSGEGWLAKRSDLELRGLCFETAGAEGCVPVFRLDLSFSLSGFHPRLLRIGTFLAEIDHLRLRATPAKPVAPGTGPLPDLRLPAFAAIFPADLDLAQLGAFKLELNQLTQETPGQPDLRAALRLEKISADPAKAKLQLRAHAERGKDLTIDARGEGEIAPQAGKFSWSGNLAGSLSGWKLQLPLELTWGEALDLRATPVARKGRDRYSAPLFLAWRREKISLGWGKFAFDQLWPAKRMIVDACRLESAFDSAKGYPKQTKLDCDLALLSLKTGALLPPMRAQVSTELSLQPLDRERVQANFQFRERGQNDYLESRVDFRGAGELNTARSALVGEPTLDFEADFKVPSLQAWKRTLENTPLAVPAPFRTLEGPCTLSLRLAEKKENELILRAELKSDLRGGTQAFVTNHLARVRLLNPWRGKKSLDIDASAELTDVALEAPPMRLGEPPQFLPDKRFYAGRAAQDALPKEASIPVAWRVKLATKNPVRIKSNLLKHEVPIALDLRLAHDADVAGTVQILPMPIALFHKKADLKFLKLSFRDGTSVGEVDGRLEHRNPEVFIKILLLGSTEKPRVEFESDPPLNRQQIVSVLLFNKSLSDLSEDEASSAGGFSQATADGALGLFSLLFLSSTPVESIAYDPVSQTYTARVRLDDKTTFSVGSDFDQERQVALRRRLGGRWAIRTELHNQEGKPDVLLTLLEWFRRF